MEDLNWKTWLLIVLMVVGVTFEAIKRIQPQNEFINLEKLGLTTTSTPYNVKYKSVNNGQAQARLPMVRPVRIAGASDVSRSTMEKFIAANKPQETSFEHKAAADGKKAVKKKKKDDGEEWEYMIDPLTGKKYRRKKKKAPMAEMKQEEVAKEEPKEDSDEDDNDQDIDSAMAQAVATGQLPPVKAKNKNPYADLEFWRRELLTHPDLAKTRRFIQYYQDGTVTADIFYKIVAMMLGDSRVKMKELAVLCAGMTPSTMSFAVLAEVVKKTNSGDSTRSYAETFLARYGDLDKLKYLQSILRSPPSNFAALLATKKLDDSAQTNLAANKNKPPKNPTPQNVNQHSNSGYYKPFVLILQGMIRGTDQELKAAAQATLATINSLSNVNGNGGPSTQPTIQPGQHNLPAQASFP